jgi:hypothetical protein
MPTETPTLIGAPYKAPRFKVGQDLAGLVACRTCHVDPEAVNGPHRVRGILDGPIPWPYTIIAGTRPQLIITAELERAIRTESVLALAYHLGVSRGWVERARRMLGVPRMNEGTRELWRQMAPEKLAAARAVATSQGYKLDPAQRRAIIKRRLRGESAAGLAREFGVTRQYVGLLVQRAAAREPAE